MIKTELLQGKIIFIQSVGHLALQLIQENVDILYFVLYFRYS